MTALDVYIAVGTGTVWIGLGLLLRRLEQRRIARLAARRPIANRYAQNERVWR